MILSMDSGHGKIRLNAESDRLSNLPDDLIHKILSFLGIKQAIKTSALSSRWRHIWTSMPCLNFSSEDFRTWVKFNSFVIRFLPRRNNQIEVSTVKLNFSGKASNRLVGRILEYAFSHNVQELNVTCYHDETDPSISFFSSQSLKTLTLTGYSDKLFNTWKLPALTTLYLYRVELYDDHSPFTNCANLKNLTLKKCYTGLNDFNICHTGLSSLTLEDGCHSINVVTPRLRNLTIKHCWRIHLVSAPDLCFLHYEDDCHHYRSPFQLSTECLHLEKVDICIQYQYHFEDKAYIHKVVCLLQQLRSVKFLTLNLELVKLLSSSVDLISHQPSPFVNLKSLKIYPHYVNGPKVTMSSEVKNYLLDGSSGATLTMVSDEEIIVVENVASAIKLMRELQELLDQWKENFETNTASIEQGKAPMESHMATVLEQVEVGNHRSQIEGNMKWHLGERMTLIEGYWEDLNEQLEKGYKNTRLTISMLRKIEGMVTKLPASHWDKFQARYSALCAEAETFMDIMMDRMKILSDKKPGHSNIYFQHELATPSHPSS